MAIGLGIGPAFKKGFSWSSYWTTRHPELATYITGLATPLSDAQIIRLGEFIEAIKTGLSITNLSDAFDIMYILAGETAESSLKNLVKNAHHGTAVNSPAFTALEGFTGNGTSMYIKTGYNGSTQGVNYSQDNASNGVYSRTQQISSALNSVEFGVGPNPTFSNTFKYSTSFYKNINSNDFNTGVSPLTTLGMHIGTRYNATSEKYYINKNNYYTKTDISSTGVKNNECYICCYSLNGSPNYFSSKQLSFVFVGRSFNQTEVNVITDSFELYMDANGKGVI